MSEAPPTLLHLPYSPWSERARWALRVRGVVHRLRSYQPVIGELALRRLLGRWRGAVSVPVLLAGDRAIADSWDIARWADAHGDGPRLFPAEHLGAVERWNRRADEGMAAGRALSLSRVLASDAALDELTPPPARKLGALARAITRAGTARTRRKYGGDQASDATHLAALTGVLDELRAALGPVPAARPATLLGAFSYADISAAQVLAFVRPPADSILRLGPATRRLFGDDALAGRYADLVGWRDALYERHGARTGAWR
jgi:glutathione S-transferase